MCAGREITKRLYIVLKTYKIIGHSVVVEYPLRDRESRDRVTTKTLKNILTPTLCDAPQIKS